MSDLRTAAQQALTEMANARDYIWLLDEGGTGVSEEEILNKIANAITALRAALAEQRLTDMEQKMERSIESLKTALAEPEGGGNLPPPLQKDFDHGIGADRFKVVRGAFWWHVLIGDSPTEHGKFRSRAGAEKMAADLLREFRNGAFVQHAAALAEPVQEPVAWTYEWKHRLHGGSLNVSRARWPESDLWIETPLYAASPQRKPLTEEEIDSIWDSEKAFADIYAIARAIERAHGIV